MSLKELRTTKSQVEYILKTYKEARNNDFLLQAIWLREFQDLDILPIKFNKIKKPSGKLETVTRVRRVIQNVEKKYPPDAKTKRGREWKEKQMIKNIRHVSII